jgi:hypothetical protein
MKKMFVVTAAALLASCAYSSGIVATGVDSYIISRSDKRATGSRVKIDTLKEANKFCTKYNMAIEIISLSSSDSAPFISAAQAELEFKCVAKK